MIQDFLFGNRTHAVLQKVLDTAALRQRVISTNIANVATPGYQARTVSFEDRLRAAMAAGDNQLKQTRPGHFPDSNMIMKINPEVAYLENGHWNGINNVNIEQEMVDLAKNQLDFDTASTLIHQEFTSLRLAIRGGQ